MNIESPVIAKGSMLPLQLLATRYGYAALLDADGNEQVITENMITTACEEAMDSLYSFLPQRLLHATAQTA